MTDITDNNNFENNFCTDLTDINREGEGHDITVNRDEEEEDGRRVYTRHERSEFIDKYKEKYFAATSASQRRSIAQLDILPKLFNHWKSRGKIYDKEGTRMKTDVRSAFNFSSLIINYLRYFQEFLRWIRNTWRPNNTANSKEKQYKITDLLWWERKEEIMDEISNSMGRESADTKTKGWFQLRMAASQNIRNKMTNEDILKLHRKGQEMREVGLQEELQRK